MSLHGNPAKILEQLWYKQYNDEKTYADLYNHYRTSPPPKNEPLSEALAAMLEQLSEGRRLLEAMGLHIKVHKVEAGYCHRKISGFRYLKAEGLHGAVPMTISVQDFPLKILANPDSRWDVKERAEPEAIALINLDPQHENSLQLSCTEGFYYWIYYNGHRINLALERRKPVQTNDHIIIGDTSLVIDWIERDLHHRATGRTQSTRPVLLVP